MVGVQSDQAEGLSFSRTITLLPDVNQDGVSRCPFSTAAINVFILFFQLFVILSSPGEDQFCFFFRAFKYHLLCNLCFIFTELLYLSRRFVSVRLVSFSLEFSHTGLQNSSRSAFVVVVIYYLYYYHYYYYYYYLFLP